MNTDIQNLLTIISKKQMLGLNCNELPLIIYIDGSVYYHCYIVAEDEKYLTVVQEASDGGEYCKVLNKDFISSIDILYEQMIPKKEPVRVNMYE